MRYTFVKGIDDGLEIDLGTNVSIICAVMEIGKALDAITFEAEMNGSELLAFMNKFSVGKDFWDKIKEENRYIVTAFDW